MCYFFYFLQDSNPVPSVKLLADLSPAEVGRLRRGSIDSSDLFDLDAAACWKDGMARVFPKSNEASESAMGGGGDALPHPGPRETRRAFAAWLKENADDFLGPEDMQDAEERRALLRHLTSLSRQPGNTEMSLERQLQDFAKKNEDAAFLLAACLVSEEERKEFLPTDWAALLSAPVAATPAARQALLEKHAARITLWLLDLNDDDPLLLAAGLADKLADNPDGEPDGKPDGEPDGEEKKQAPGRIVGTGEKNMRFFTALEIRERLGSIFPASSEAQAETESDEAFFDRMLRMLAGAKQGGLVPVPRGGFLVAPRFRPAWLELVDHAKALLLSLESRLREAGARHTDAFLPLAHIARMYPEATFPTESQASASADPPASNEDPQNQESETVCLPLELAGPLCRAWNLEYSHGLISRRPLALPQMRAFKLFESFRKLLIQGSPAPVILSEHQAFTILKESKFWEPPATGRYVPRELLSLPGAAVLLRGGFVVLNPHYLALACQADPSALAGKNLTPAPEGKQPAKPASAGNNPASGFLRKRLDPDAPRLAHSSDLESEYRSLAENKASTASGPLGPYLFDCIDYIRHTPSLWGPTKISTAGRAFRRQWLLNEEALKEFLYSRTFGGITSFFGGITQVFPAWEVKTIHQWFDWITNLPKSKHTDETHHLTTLISHQVTTLQVFARKLKANKPNPLKKPGGGKYPPEPAPTDSHPANDPAIEAAIEALFPLPEPAPIPPSVWQFSHIYGLVALACGPVNPPVGKQAQEAPHPEGPGFGLAAITQLTNLKPPEAASLLLLLGALGILEPGPSLRGHWAPGPRAKQWLNRLSQLLIHSPELAESSPFHRLPIPPGATMQTRRARTSALPADAPATDFQTPAQLWASILRDELTLPPPSTHIAGHLVADLNLTLFSSIHAAGQSPRGRGRPPKQNTPPPKQNP